MNAHAFLRWFSPRHLALAALAFLVAAEARAVTYLKADAPEGGDGTSWASAFRNAEEAVKDALAKDKVVYASRGVYIVTNKMEVTDGFQIYGGFAGLSADETLESRDVESHQTILTGDRDLDDFWSHVVPVPGKYRTVSTNLVDETVISNGVVHFPPPYLGDFDAYQPVFPKNDRNSACAFKINAGVSAGFDGLWFTGFKANGNEGNCFDITSGAGKTTIENCRFIGNRTNHGQIGDNSGKARISRCQFRFGMTGSRAAGVSIRGATLIEDCLFESLPRDGANGGGVLYFWSGENAMVRRCVFSRSITVNTAEWFETNYGGPGNIVASEGGTGSFVDCVISNTFSATPFRYGVPIFAIRNGSVLRCSFINNRYEVKPVGGRTYVLFGNACSAGHRLSYEGCTFRGNVIAAPVVAAPSETDYVLGVLGNASAGHSLSVVNCTFDSNDVEYVEKEGVTPICSRALVSSSTAMNTGTELGVANCTFAGPAREGLYDIVQYGTAHRTTLTVLNSVFMGDRTKAISPFFITDPALFTLRDCTVENMLAPPAWLDATGLQSDTIPFAREDEATVSHVPVLAPLVKTPGIRETADIATNTSTKLLATFRYRLRGETDWKPLLPSLGGAEATEALPVADANANARSFGAFTRGAVQPLAPAAETGCNLVLRCDPYYGGTLSEPSTQAVEPGRPIVPVTALPSEMSSFRGWHTVDGSLYSEEATLSIPALEEDLILVARFGAPKVNVVFDLGEAGLFEESGARTITLAVEVGSHFPAVPAYGASDRWYLYGWDRDFPETVPASDSVFHARYVTKDVRVLHVVPAGEVPEGSDRSGDSWANATDDLRGAYADAGLYRGEVWMKGGTYLVVDSLIGKPNVSILGGFAGTEAAADEADPVAYPTILTGDKNGDTYWAPEQRWPAAADQVPIWKDGLFMEPNPDGADDYWVPIRSSGDDTPVCLMTYLEPMTNAVLSGLTFTCFQDEVLRLSSGRPDLLVRDCRFLANGGKIDTWNFAAVHVADGRISMEDCEFVGNVRSCWIATADPDLSSTFARCLFRENASGAKGPCLRADKDASLVATDCVFRRNCAYGDSYNNGVALAHDNALVTRLENCLFEGNRMVGEHPSAVVSYTGYSKGGYSSETIGCRFVGNRMALTKQESYQATCLSSIGVSVAPLIGNCFFASNRVEVAETVAKGIVGSVGVARPFGSLIFENCTMMENEVVNHSSFEGVGTICAIGNLSIINCLFEKSRFTGPAAEFVWASDHATRVFSMMNTVARNETPGYKAFAITPAEQTVCFANCAISGVEPETLATGSDGFCVDVTPLPGPVSRIKTGPGGLPAVGIANSSPYARAGRPVWLGDDGNFYFYDEVALANHKAPWFRLGIKHQRFSSVAGVTPETAPRPDAFGAPRRAGRIAYGPLNVSVGGTIMILR